MNREQYLNLRTKSSDIYTTEEIINKIFDDFESRVCENCEYFNLRAGYKRACEHEERIGAGLGTIGDGWLPKNFGCNKFEVKIK